MSVLDCCSISDIQNYSIENEQSLALPEFWWNHISKAGA